MNTTPTSLLPCPMCGKENPFTYISSSCAILECSCGVGIRDAAVRVLYKRDELPAELVPYSYEATALVIRDENNNEVKYPDHGYVGVNVHAAFEVAGFTAKWNKRAAQ